MDKLDVRLQPIELDSAKVDWPFSDQIFLFISNVSYNKLLDTASLSNGHQMLVFQLWRNFAHSAIFFCANPSLKKYIFPFPFVAGVNGHMFNGEGAGGERPVS